jgi:hypothetical protein
MREDAVEEAAEAEQDPGRDRKVSAAALRTHAGALPNGPRRRSDQPGSGKACRRHDRLQVRDGTICMMRNSDSPGSGITIAFALAPLGKGA